MEPIKWMHVKRQYATVTKPSILSFRMPVAVKWATLEVREKKGY